MFNGLSYNLMIWLVIANMHLLHTISISFSQRLKFFYLYKVLQINAMSGEDVDECL